MEVHKVMFLAWVAHGSTESSLPSERHVPMDKGVVISTRLVNNVILSACGLVRCGKTAG